MNSRWAMAHNDRIENVAIWDGVTEWDYGDFEIFELEQDSPIGIGWVRVDGVWTMPAPVLPPDGDGGLV